MTDRNCFLNQMFSSFSLNDELLSGVPTPMEPLPCRYIQEGWWRGVTPHCKKSTKPNNSESFNTIYPNILLGPGGHHDCDCLKDAGVYPGFHERTTTAKNMGILKYHPTSLISYERGWPLACLGDLIKPNQASHQGAR
jgi:hypothetical protein